MMKKPSPNPTWQMGAKIESPVDEMVECDFSNLSQQDAYKLIIGSVVPRPIALVSSCNLEGQGNLAPFSFFNAVSSNPPCIVIAITRKPDGSKKDTLLNIESTKEFVVNSVAKWMIEPVNQCSANYPHGVNEMEAVGLTPLPSTEIKPNRVKESPIQMECRLEQIIHLGEAQAGASALVIGKIIKMHIHKKAYDHGRILFEGIEPISRLAGNSYGVTNEVFDIDRPK